MELSADDVTVVKDTTDAMSVRYRELLMARPGVERLLMGCDMLDTARALLRSAVAPKLTNRTLDGIPKTVLDRFAEIAAWRKNVAAARDAGLAKAASGGGSG